MGPDEGDAVVGELDVYFRAPHQHTELHLLQYPLRHARSTIGSERRIAHVQLRPRHARLQLKLALYPQLDEFTQTKSFNPDTPVEKHIGQHQTLVSHAHLQPPQSNYVVGAYVPNAPSGPAFTILPIRAVQQLRPTFSHIDDHDRNQLLARAERKGLLASSAVEAPSEAAPLQLSFRRRETERAAERRRNSYATLTQREHTDDWLPLDFAHADRQDVQARKNALFACTQVLDVKDLAFQLGTTYTDLFDLHTRHLRAGFVAKASVDKENLSAKQLRTLSTDSAVACAVKQARIVRISELHQLVGTHRPAEELLSSLRKCAVCIRGLWVSKRSSRDVGKKSAAERYDACRTLILDLFRTNNVVRTCDAIQTLGEPLLISFSGVLSVLQEVGERQSGVGWKLRLVADEYFVMQNEALCRMFDEEWERAVENAREKLAKCIRRKR